MICLDYVRTHIRGTTMLGMGDIVKEVKAIDSVAVCFLSANMSLLEADHINRVLKGKDFLGQDLLLAEDATRYRIHCTFRKKGLSIKVQYSNNYRAHQC